MATYYIGADVHSNNTELAIEQRGKIVSRYSVPTTIPSISNRHKHNGFKKYYERMLSNGVTPANARHSVARKMISVMSGMWKTNSKYDPKML